MALTLTEVFREREKGQRKVAAYTAAFDATYTTGYVIAPSDVGMDVRIDAITVMDDNTFYSPKFDLANKTLRVGTDGASGGELANGSTVLSGHKCTLFVWGS